jgi:hypothetical protein
MPRTLSELLKEIARQASESDETVLADLCRMAALEAAHTDIGLNWDWDAAKGSRQPDEMSERFTVCPQESSVTAKPYQVWTRKGTGSYSVLVPNAKAALAAVNELSGRGHLGVFIKDMDGKDVDLEILQVIVDLEANPTLRLVRR